jgi:hypothetical protein
MSTICNELAEMTRSKSVEVEHIRVGDGRIAVEGSFKSPPLSHVSVDDQAFAMESVRCHGINAMRYNRLV